MVYKGLLRNPFALYLEKQLNISLINPPRGLHAIFIRSVLSAMQIYEQTVTCLGWIQSISSVARIDQQRRRKTSGKTKSVNEESVLTGL